MCGIYFSHSYIHPANISKIFCAVLLVLFLNKFPFGSPRNIPPGELAADARPAEIQVVCGKEAVFFGEMCCRKGDEIPSRELTYPPKMAF